MIYVHKFATEMRASAPLIIAPKNRRCCSHSNFLRTETVDFSDPATGALCRQRLCILTLLPLLFGCQSVKNALTSLVIRLLTFCCRNLRENETSDAKSVGSTAATLFSCR